MNFFLRSNRGFCFTGAGPLHQDTRGIGGCEDDFGKDGCKVGKGKEEAG